MLMQPSVGAEPGRVGFFTVAVSRFPSLEDLPINFGGKFPAATTHLLDDFREVMSWSRRDRGNDRRCN